MRSPLDDVSCARLPAAALAALAPLRCEPGLEVARDGEDLWLRWDTASERVLRAVLPLVGSELFAARGGLWFRPGRALPSFEVPQALEYRPLYQVLFPAPVEPAALAHLAVTPVRLTLRADDRARATSALLCPLPPLLAWADTIPAGRLATLRGLRLYEQVLVVGERLPPITGERFWGENVLVPLGYRPEPELPESALRQAAGLLDGEVLLLRQGAAEVFARSLLAPLSRPVLRLAGEEVGA